MGLEFRGRNGRSLEIETCPTKRRAVQLLRVSFTLSSATVVVGIGVAVALIALSLILLSSSTDGSKALRGEE